MNMRPGFSVVLCLLLLFYSCNTTPQQQTVQENPLPADLFDSSRDYVQAQLKILASSGDTLLSAQDTLIISDSVLALYKQNHFKPFWLRQDRIENVLHILKESYYDGLNPEDYHHDSLAAVYKKYRQNGAQPAEALKLEVRLTEALWLYVKHMYLGKVDPLAVFPEWNYVKLSDDKISAAFLVNYFNSNLDSLSENLRPDYVIYNNLRKGLYQLDKIKGKGFIYQAIPASASALKPGDTSFIILDIKKRLQSTSEYNFDSLTNRYDEQMVESIKIFQSHVGIRPTGLLDKKTVNVLSFTMEEVYNAIRVNMERFRWLPHDLPEEFILVNIADYTLRHFVGRNVAYQESVIVGQEVKSTPVFQAMMSYIEFNPYWTVPHSIAVNEMLPLLKKNPDYLKAHNMDLFLGNKEVAVPSSFSSYTSSSFPFVIRENPGPKNSLGQVKFMFPNPYSIYIHDTPGRYLFDRDERSFSHGCIRLKDPLKFAAHLLAPQGMTQKNIDRIIQSKKNYPVALKKQMPVMIVYFTCYSVNADPHLYFFKDIYGRDQKIIELLDVK